MKVLLASAAALAVAASGALSARQNDNAQDDNAQNDTAGRAAEATTEVGPDFDMRAADIAERIRTSRDRVRSEQVPPVGNGNTRPTASRDERASLEQTVAGAVRDVQAQGRTEIGRDTRGRVPANRGGGIASQVASRAVNVLDRTDSGLVDGCPPGLIGTRGCAAPPRATERRSLFGTAYGPGLFGYDRYREGRYFYDKGYLIRLDPDGEIASYLPLIGGALSIGNAWPTGYRNSPLPDYYVDYYDLGRRDSYRYADDVVYRVDPDSSAIQSIAALLTGDRFTVGEQAPTGYDVYNVPYAYRDRYADTAEASYRYADGHIYRINPADRTVIAAIDLLA